MTIKVKNKAMLARLCGAVEDEAEAEAGVEAEDGAGEALEKLYQVK